ncbi:CBS domain-containing protein [Candidatus Bathyarchaeota archaeon]|nr:CBS domain-containing protein [Candidatus Bathyarchaeota archaeon]
MRQKPIIELARTELVTRNQHASIAAIAKSMIENTVGSVFLVDDEEKVCGMITDKAIFALIADGKNPLEMQPVEMMEEIRTVKRNTDALDVLEMMEANELSRVGIISEKGKIIGVVSRKKLKFEKLRILKDELGIRA